MEDTIGRMEDSLSKNEVKSFKKKQVLAQMNQNKKYMFSPDKPLKRNESGKLRDSWINRSKEMRQSFMSKLQIEWFIKILFSHVLIFTSRKIVREGRLSQRHPNRRKSLQSEKDLRSQT